MPIDTDNAQTTPAAAGAADNAASAAAGAPPAQTPTAGDSATAPRTLKDAVSKALSEADEGAPAPESAEDPPSDEDPAGDEPAGDDPVAQPNEDTAAAEADPDLVPPDGLSKGARERFGKLIERVKEGDQRFAELDGKFRGIEQTLKGTGATPEQWGQILTAMRYANSGDPAQARMALQIIDGYRAEIARAAGVPIEGVDVLSDFPDLRAKVDSGTLDEESAAELAAQRRAVDRNRATVNQQEQQRQQAQQLEQRQNTARASLDALGSQLAKSDVDYPRKIEILEKRGVIANIVATVPPEQWQASFKSAYDALGDVAAAARTPAPGPNEQPMRRSSKSGSGAEAQPKTVRDAVRAALNEV